jgi:hypothetical protein
LQRSARARRQSLRSGNFGHGNDPWLV